MKVLLSDRELLGVWDYMRQAGHGGEELLAQAETWETLGLGSRFEAIVKALSAGKPGEATAFDLKGLDATLAEYELSDAAVTYLRTVFMRNPQGIAMVLQSAAALKRLDRPPATGSDIAAPV